MAGVLPFTRNDEGLSSDIVTGVSSVVAADQDIRKNSKAVVQVRRKSQLAERGADVWELTFYARRIIKPANVAEDNIQDLGRAEGVRVIDRHRVSIEMRGTTGTGIGDVPEAVKTCRVEPLFGISSAEQVAVAKAMIDLDVELIV